MPSLRVKIVAFASGNQGGKLEEMAWIVKSLPYFNFVADDSDIKQIVMVGRSSFDMDS